MKTILLLLVCIAGATGCTDAERAKYGGLGKSAHVKCWSGAVVIYDGYSTGKVSSERQSDGYFFRDRADGKLREVSGNCVIEYGD